MARPVRVLLSCEHGGNQIPDEYTALFAPHCDILNSHRGYDMGALEMARAIADATTAPLFACETSRLLVDPNRSPWHHQLFSRYTRALSREQRHAIVQQYYAPYRAAIEQFIRRSIEENKAVLHLSIHSFTPVLDNEERQADIGVLYDPRRKREVHFAQRITQAFRESHPELRCRKNYPYRGISDGLPSFLRKVFDYEVYMGIELEFNQALFEHDRPQWDELAATLTRTLSTDFPARR